MELKIYQQSVLDDLDLYIEELDKQREAGREQ